MSNFNIGDKVTFTLHTVNKRGTVSTLLNAKGVIKEIYGNVAIVSHGKKQFNVHVSRLSKVN